ncbi:MAG: 2-phosphosulfolactate phosphatase [Bacteroidales bacterium]|nr:2-phosphosulfolactate phosphatase [Bacteroidales bacterium]
MQPIEVCFSPALYKLYHSDDKCVVIIDILRATTSICAAIAAGAEKILPVASVDDALKAKQQGYIVAAEREGKVLDFADFGNSPDLFTPERVKNKTIAYSTTNGTQAIDMAKQAKLLLIASFINLSAINQHLASHPQPLLLFCSGWKNKFNLEDTLCAGAIAYALIQSGKYFTQCDSTLASIDLWLLAKDNLSSYLEKASHRHRLKNIVDDSVIKYCLSLNLTNVIPYYQDGFIKNMI